MDRNSVIKFIYKYFIFFLLGGAIYYAIEIVYRGHSHISMVILGGICFILIGLINELFPWELCIEVQAVIGAIIVTVLEFFTGLIVNIWLQLNVWDYSNMPFNLGGQICLPFSLIWIAISVVVIIFDDHVRHVCFNEQVPKYRSCIVDWIKKIIDKDDDKEKK